MSTRATKSSAALTKISVLPNRRAPPPGCLSAAEAIHWQNIVRALPGDWFDAADLLLLTIYCQAIAQHESVCGALQGESLVLEAANGRQYRNPLLAIQDAAARRMLNIAAKLRLTPSSRYDAKKANTAFNRGPAGKRPWSPDLEDILNS